MAHAWILDMFAHLMLAVAAVSAFRLMVVLPWRRRESEVVGTNIAYLLVAVAMAGILTPSLATLTPGVWEAIFTVLTAWFAYLIVRDVRSRGPRALTRGNRAPYLACSACVLYMLGALATTAASADGGMEGMSGLGGSPGSVARTLGYPTLAHVFELILVAYGVWDLERLLAGRESPAHESVSRTAGSELAVAGYSGTHIANGSVVRAILLSPAAAAACRVVMGITMVCALLIMS